MVDFVLVTLLLVVLVLGIVQLGLVLHERNVLVAAAAEGARYGANADRTPEQGGQRAIEVVADALSAGTAARLTASTGTPLSSGGLQTVEVTLTGAMPLVFLPVGPLSLTVHGHALREAR